MENKIAVIGVGKDCTPVPKAIVLIGNIGDGKSTWAKNYVKEHPGTVIVNKDSIREMLLGEYKYDKAYEPLVHETSYACATFALTSGFDVILDETNINVMQRTKLIGDINRAFMRPFLIQYVLFARSEEGLRRRLQEPRGYAAEKWTEVWNNFNALYEAPDQTKEKFDFLEEIPCTSF